MIYIIGVNHELQYLDPSTGLFVKALREWSASCKVSLIAEELNQEAIDKEGKTRNQTLESTCRHVASSLGLEHRFCDPDNSERASLGIRSGRQIRRDLGVRAGENEELVEMEFRKDWPIREAFWLDRISDKIDEDLLFICGSSHVDNFVALVESKGHRVAVLYKDCGPESKLDDILSEGVVIDVYEAEWASDMANFIKRNRETLNEGYPGLFMDLERILTVWIFLALARMFEKKKERSPYPIRTIPEALKILQESNILIKDKSTAINSFEVDDSVKQRLAKLNDSDLLKWIASYFHDELSKICGQIETVNTKRDKIVAHREAIDEMNLKLPQWEEIDTLIKFGKCFYEVVGKGIVGRPIDSDPERVTRSLKRLLTQAGLSVD